MTTANTAISATYQLPAAYLPVHGIGYSTHDIVTEDVAFEPSRNGVSYVDAECGRGKTYSTCQWIKACVGMRNQMYIAPTTALLEQTAAQLEKLRLPYGELDEATRLAKIDQVKKTYLAIPKGQGLRNHGFYQAALDLADLMTLPEVEAVLFELADGEKKMLDRIPDKIQTVKRKKYN